MIEEVYQPEQEQEQELTLKERAEQIRDEKETGENTAERVGGLLVAMVEKDEDTAEAVEALKEKQQDTASDVTELQEQQQETAGKVEKLGESLSTLQGKQETTEQNVSTLQGQQKATSQEVSDLRSKQVEIGASVETLQGQQKTTAQEVSALKEKQKTTAADVAELEVKQGQQGQSIDTLQQQQQATAGDVSALREQQNATTQEVGTLKGQQQTTASDVIGLQAQQKDTAGKVEALQQKQTTTDTNVTKLRTDVDTLQGQQKTTDASVKALGESLDEHKKSAEETYAKQDGTYEDLTAGNAVNLQGTTEMTNSSAYRTTGGNEDVLFGTAQVLSVQGNSVAWNQLYPPQSVTTESHETHLVFNEYEAKITREGKADTGENLYPIRNLQNVIKGHKYLPKAKVAGSFNSKLQLRYDNEEGQVQWIDFNKIFSCVYSNTLSVAFRLLVSDTDINLTYSNIQLFDLTLIYGAGKEPTTPEQFEADYQRWFGKPLTYEEYDEGSIRTTLASGIKTVGFNLVHVPDYSGSVSNFVEKKKPNITFFENNFGYQGSFVLSCDAKYDSAEKGLGLGLTIFYNDGTKQGKIIEDGHNNITTLGNVARIEWSYNKEKQISLSNFCLNMSWSGKRDGEYEPYWSETQPLPLTTLKGKLNGEGESVVVFPDGMKRAGTIYDEIKVENGVTKAIKRVGSVDLGTLTWTLYNERTHSYYVYLYGATSIEDYSTVSDAFTAKYQSVGYNSAHIESIDKSISVRKSNNERSAVCICDSSYIEDASALKQSLQDVILYYELAEPQEYIIDDFELPLVYRIDDFGTEQILQPENSIAPTIITKYGINAVDAIRRMPKNYISSIAMDNFLAKLSEVMGGTWSKSWNESRGGYDFNFVPSEEAAEADGGGEIPAQ